MLEKLSLRIAEARCDSTVRLRNVSAPDEVLEGDTMIDIVAEAMAGPAQPEN